MELAIPTGINIAAPRKLASNVLGATTNLIEHHVRLPGTRNIVVCFDIPFIFFEKILEKRNVPMDDLIFVDAVTRVSGDIPIGRENVRMMNGPFFLPEIYAEIALILREDSGGDKCVIIDNLTNTITFNSMDSVKKFLKNLIELFLEVKLKRAVLIIERERNPMLFNYMKNDIEGVNVFE